MPTPLAINASPPDEELMARISEGDDRALGLVYDRHAPMVFSLTRAITGTDSDAEEAAEAVFIHLWTNPAQFNPARGSVSAYLATMARSRARDQVRSLHRRHDAVLRSAAAGGGEFAAPVSNPGSDPERDVLRREARDQLDGLLQELSDEQREAIELAFFGGMTQTEIATELSVPLGTVKTRIRDGMARLRDTVRRRGLLP